MSGLRLRRAFYADFISEAPPSGPFDVTLRNPGAGFNVRFDDAPAGGGSTFTETATVTFGAAATGSGAFVARPVGAQAVGFGSAATVTSNAVSADQQAISLVVGSAPMARAAAARTEAFNPAEVGAATAVVLTITQQGIIAAEAAGLVADATAGATVLIAPVVTAADSVVGGPQTVGEVGAVPIVFVVTATATVRAAPAVVVAVGPAAAGSAAATGRATGAQAFGPTATGGSQATARGLAAQAVPLVVTWSDSASAGPMTVVEVGSIGFAIVVASLVATAARATGQQAMGAAAQGAALAGAQASEGVGVALGASGLPAANVAALAAVSWGMADAGGGVLRTTMAGAVAVGVAAAGLGIGLAADQADVAIAPQAGGDAWAMAGVSWAQGFGFIAWGTGAAPLDALVADPSGIGRPARDAVAFLFVEARVGALRIGDRAAWTGRGRVE